MNALHNKNTHIDEGKFKFLNSYLHGIKNILNKFSHKSFEGTMALFTDRFQVYESQRFNRTMMTCAVYMLETPLIAIINHVYQTEI